MSLIGMRDVCWGLGGTPLLENITFQIDSGERVALLGRNGVGKSTLLKLLTGDIRPDSGEVWRQQGAVVSALVQEVPQKMSGTLFEVAADGLGDIGRSLIEYHRIDRQPESALDDDCLRRREALQHRLDTQGGWNLLNRLENLLTKSGLDPEARFSELSAGMKRRGLLTRALVSTPDVLLLDEPTNHLDIAAIQWMESFVGDHVKTLLFITHDRAFLKHIASRIMELDRGRLSTYPCDYSTYLKRREAAAAAEAKHRAEFDRKLSREEAWIRQGIKARRRRNQGRVRALQRMREERRARREKSGDARLQVQEARRTGKIVIETEGVSYAYDGTPILNDFSTLILRGDKIGIIGPNGSGKTTLLNILLRQLPPDAGLVKHGTHLEVAYFDQLRMQLDEDHTVLENIAEGNDFITFNNERRHVISYLGDFLFSPDRCRTPVRVLSGGEKNRLMLAKLFARPANVLVMDEPTNDLDIETLELLEELLFSFSGTVLLVSHDRAFLNNVVTSTLVFEKEGRVIEYAGGYDDWLIQRQDPPENRPPPQPTRPKPQPKPKSARQRKLGFNEKRELEELPRKIEALEAEHDALSEKMSDPTFYRKDSTEISRAKARMEALEKDIDSAYRRWEVLEEMANSSG